MYKMQIHYLTTMSHKIEYQLSHQKTEMCTYEINLRDFYNVRYKNEANTLKILYTNQDHNGLPWWLRQYSVCLQCGTPGFNPWVGKISWKRE